MVTVLEQLDVTLITVRELIATQAGVPFCKEKARTVGDPKCGTASGEHNLRKIRLLDSA